MDNDHSSSDGQRAVSGVSKQRACDECRTRKIRCDRKPPCSHCRAAGLVCRVSVQRPKERKSRVIISKEYENKIDRIESRLSNIEDLLRSNLAAQKINTPRTDRPDIQDLRTGLNDIEEQEESSGLNAAFSGFTGPNADSILAKDVVEQTVGGSSIAWQDEQLSAALMSLQQIVGKMRADSAEPSLRPTGITPSSQPDDLVVPPWDEAKPLLERAQRNVSWYNSATFMLNFPSMTIGEFYEKCSETYERNHDVSPVRRLLVYAGLSGLAAEYSAVDTGRLAEYHAKLAGKYQQWVSRSLANFPLLVPATMESIEALMAGSTFAIDMCKPSLSQTLTAAAATVCQKLGYHRLSTMTNDRADLRNRKIVLFWLVYLMDKTISLRLGHASAIQDYEIALPQPEPSESFSPAFIHLMNYWINVSRIQGQISQQLYSPAALTQSTHVRAERAQKLAQELQAAYDVRVKANDEILELFTFGESNNFIAKQLLNGGDTIMHYSTLTLILHAVPSMQPGTSPAVQAARAALRASPDMNHYGTQNNFFWTIYCHWITLNTPLTPFTVLFCHILANNDDCHEDLQLLERFILTLQQSRAVSEGVERFFQLCSVFWKVAETYVRAKKQEAKLLHEANNMLAQGSQTASLQPVLGEFDEYLSALGLAPQPFLNGPNEVMSSTTGMNADMSTYLQDWYSGNANLYGLLEQDLSNIAGLDFAQNPAWNA